MEIPEQVPVKSPIPANPYPQEQYPQASVPLYVDGIPLQNPNSITPVEWSSGLCGCCQDRRNCFITCCCPCITVGQIAEVVDDGNTSCGNGCAIYAALECVGAFILGYPCGCLYSMKYRTKLRNKYSLKEGSCGDCLVHCCCDPCAICQEYRELKIRGVDPSIGWQGNVEKWNRAGSTMPPTVAPGMMR